MYTNYTIIQTFIDHLIKMSQSIIVVINLILVIILFINFFQNLQI